MKLYRVTDENGLARSEMFWRPGLQGRASMRGHRMCDSSELHAYETQELAALLYPYHTRTRTPMLWEAEAEGVTQEGLRVRCKRLTAVNQIPMPEIRTPQRIRISASVVLAWPEYGPGDGDPFLVEMAHRDREYARSWCRDVVRRTVGAVAQLDRSGLTPSPDIQHMLWVDLAAVLVEASEFGDVAAVTRRYLKERHVEAEAAGSGKALQEATRSPGARSRRQGKGGSGSQRLRQGR